MKIIKHKNKEYELEDKDAILIEVLQDLTRAINKLRVRK